MDRKWIGWIETDHALLTHKVKVNYIRSLMDGCVNKDPLHLHDDRTLVSVTYCGNAYKTQVDSYTW